MGQDDGATKAPGGAASPVRPQEQRAPGASSTAAIAVPAAAAAAVAAAAPQGSAKPTFEAAESGNKDTPRQAMSGGTAPASPVTLQLELQRLRKDAEESRRWASEVESAHVKAEVGGQIYLTHLGLNETFFLFGLCSECHVMRAHVYIQGELQGQLHSLRAQVKLLEGKMELQSRQRDEAEAALQKQAEA